MRHTNPDFYLEKIAESPGPARLRLSAIRDIRYPTFAFLKRIIRSDAPLKMRALAVKLYQQKLEAEQHATEK